MLIQEFSFGNLRSFKDIQTINLAASKIKSSDSNIDKFNVYKKRGIRDVSFLKSKAIYGANSSGKSNIMHALVNFIRIIKLSVKDDTTLSYIEPFEFSTETENEPSFFQLTFWIKTVKYRYGFEADSKKITAEWLYCKSGDREIPYFIREKQKIIEIDKTNFSEGVQLSNLIGADKSSKNDVFRSDSLFLSSLASFGFGHISKDIVDSISSIFVISGLSHKGMYSYAAKKLDNNKIKNYMIDFLQKGDIGLKRVENVDITADELPNDADEDLKKQFGDKRRFVVSFRTKFDKNNKPVKDIGFAFQMHESEGTKKMFELSPFIYEALNEKRVIIVDEFDARFHPLLTREILKLFNSVNNKGAQFIFATHDTNLLSHKLLRRDQIDFVEKDKYGASHLYSLVQFKGIRNNASFEKDYIHGKYGAIPFLGDFSELTP